MGCVGGTEQLGCQKLRERSRSLTSQPIFLPARLQSLPLGKQEPSALCDLSWVTRTPAASSSLDSLIRQPQSALLPSLQRASMFPPACQYLTTLSSYITSPALNPTPALQDSVPVPFNSTSLDPVP